MSKTLQQITNDSGWPKARELIEFGGHHALEAADRALLNVLYQHAHDSGKLTQPDAEWTIPLVDLRFSRSHTSNDRIRQSLDRLLSVVVTVPYIAPDGEPRLVKTNLVGFFDVSATDDRSQPTLRFGLPKKLQPVLAASGKWGRIKAEVVMAMTSKYAIALYEQVQARANLDKSVEVFSLDRFRDLMGVPPGKLLQGSHLKQKVIDPAVLEVNGLSDISVTLEVKRKGGPLSPIVAVAMAWWKKDVAEFREAMKERTRPKVGRMARLKGTVEKVDIDTPPLPIEEAIAESKRRDEQSSSDDPISRRVLQSVARAAGLAPKRRGRPPSPRNHDQ